MDIAKFTEKHLNRFIELKNPVGNSGDRSFKRQRVKPQETRSPENW